MKIRESIHRRVVATVVALAGLMGLSMTWLSGHAFFEGMDKVMLATMIEAALETEVSDGHPASIMNIQVASRWQDLPQSIQQNLDKPTEPTALLINVTGFPPFTEPEYGYFATLVPMKDGTVRYVSREFQKGKEPHIKFQGMDPLIFTIVSALMILVLFMILLKVSLVRVSRPVERLGQWASNLDHNSIKEPPPDFRYMELNRLAGMIRASLSTIEQNVERKREFLQNASHELRTPISVLRTSTSLLRKLSPNASSKQQAVLERIERASITMSDLTHTLLWLERETDDALPCIDLSLEELTHQLSDELNYLLQGREVSLELDTQPGTLPLPGTVCRIVLTNLIRNAFQHTASGLIQIRQRDAEITIINPDSDEYSEELGFGLGLKLVEKLVEQYHWTVERYEKDGTHITRVHFESQLPVSIDPGS